MLDPCCIRLLKRAMYVLTIQLGAFQTTVKECRSRKTWSLGISLIENPEGWSASDRCQVSSLSALTPSTCK